MKTLRFWLQDGRFLIMSFAILACTVKVFAQTTDSSLVPVVTVLATRPIATVTNPGVFTLFRAGNTNLTLNVWYDLTGTASNGVDYALIPPYQVTIAAGEVSNTIVITPLMNPPPPGAAKTVVLTLTNSPMMPPVNYEIGSPHRAAVDIESSSATNLLPVVRILGPANGSVYHAPINLPLYAYAADPDGDVTSVEFFAGTNDLGFGRRLPVVEPLASGGVVVGGPVPPIYPTNLFFLIWTNVPVGTNALTTMATDNGGLSSTSALVNITIRSPLPPLTNRPSVVNITATDPVAVEGTNCWVWRGETNSSPTWAAWPTAVCRCFTNCGPKTATFTVRRLGETNNELTVTYAIGGSASNGLDYVALPGFVTIPAGGRHAFITIVPIDDGPPDVNKTVILTLTASTNLPPDYLLGFPRRAAAIIIDQGPCPATGMLPSDSFHLAEAGPDAAWYYIEHSTNLVNWTPVCTNQVINGSIDFVDPDTGGNPSRFYRAVPLTNPPSE